MTKIKNFLKQLFFGTTNYTNIKCDCGSEKLEYYNESADGFYVEKKVKVS